VDTDEAERDLHVGGAGLVLDEVEGLESHGLGTVHMRASGSAQAQLQLAGVNPGKDFSAELAADENDYEASENEVNRQDQPADANDVCCQARVTLAEPCEAAFFFRLVALSLFMSAQKPDRKNWNQRAGEQI